MEETVPKVSASMRRTLTTIQLKWDHKTLKILYGDIQAYVLLFTLVRVNGEPVAKSEQKKIIICGSFEEYLLTNLSKFSQYSIQMAIFTAKGVGKYSDPTYGGTRHSPFWNRLLIFIPGILKYIYLQQTIDTNPRDTGVQYLSKDIADTNPRDTEVQYLQQATADTNPRATVVQLSATGY